MQEGREFWELRIYKPIAHIYKNENITYSNNIVEKLSQQLVENRRNSKLRRLVVRWVRPWKLDGLLIIEGNFQFLWVIWLMTKQIRWPQYYIRLIYNLYINYTIIFLLNIIYSLDCKKTCWLPNLLFMLITWCTSFA